LKKTFEPGACIRGLLGRGLKRGTTGEKKKSHLAVEGSLPQRTAPIKPNGKNGNQRYAGNFG